MRQERKHHVIRAHSRGQALLSTLKYIRIFQEQRRGHQRTDRSGGKVLQKHVACAEAATEANHKDGSIKDNTSHIS